MISLRFTALAALLAVVFAPATARAQFGDCTSRAYLEAFAEGGEVIEDLECIEVFRIELPSGAFVRAITDVRGGWAVSASDMANVEAGTRLAVEQMARMGIGDVGHITILLQDGPYEFPEDPHGARTGGITTPIRTPPGEAEGGGPLPRECTINIYTLTGRSAPVLMQNIAAHEFFHCVQQYVVPAQAAIYEDGGVWWQEGSAEAFSALAVPNSQPYNNRARIFDTSVRNRRPLSEASYGAGVFFHWWVSENGASNLMGFLAQMADTPGQDAQHAAMRNAVTDDEWIAFVQAYVDGTIPHPQGGNLPTSPTPKGPIKPYRNGDRDLQFMPFTVEHWVIDFECGLWEVELRPDDVNISVAQRGGDWMEWPEEFDTREGREGWHDVVVFHTGDTPLDVNFDFRRTATCTPCAGQTAVDACLAGTWEMTGGGPVEWMRAQGLPLNNVSEGPRHVQFFSDGLFRAGATELELTLNLEGGDWSRGEGVSFESIGNWAADKETEDMTFCQMAGGVQGTVTVSIDGREYTSPVAQGGAAQTEMTYKCNVDSGTLTTQMEVPGFAPMSTTYSRISEEPNGVLVP